MMLLRTPIWRSTSNRLKKETKQNKTKDIYHDVVRCSEIFCEEKTKLFVLWLLFLVLPRFLRNFESCETNSAPRQDRLFCDPTIAQWTSEISCCSEIEKKPFLSLSINNTYRFAFFQKKLSHFLNLEKNHKSTV